MAYDARVLLDSVACNGVRLITLEVTFPRFVLAEFNTHRQFCLDGDTLLYFDLPSKSTGGAQRRFTLSIRDFYEKWHYGAAPRANRRRTKIASDLDPERCYTAKELAAIAGYSDYTGVDLLTRRMAMNRIIVPGQPYRAGLNRQPIRDRLASMHLRSCNEETGEIYHTRVRDVFFSGRKPVFRVTLTNGQQIVSSKDHQFLTKEGWQTLERAVGLSLSRGNIATWSRSAEFAVNGIAAYEDPKWLAGMREAGLSLPRIANYCGVSLNKVKSVRRKHRIGRTSIAWSLSHPEEPSNKGRRHVEAGRSFDSFWGFVGGLRFRRPYGAKPKRAVVRHFLALKSVEYAGERDTYDLEVVGPYYNFVAGGFIVHNSRNSASSRAVPSTKLIERVEQDPVLPLEWGRNKAGMSAADVLSESDAVAAQRAWLAARDDAVKHARELHKLNVHKQELNRILEPFLWHTVIVTATEWENFFALRCTRSAQPEIREAACRMRDAIAQSTPRPIAAGSWHTPLVLEDEYGLDAETRKRISAARCARVSYLTHEGRRELAKDLDLYERLWRDRHLSPFEHVATPSDDAGFHANFRGWIQMRAEIEALGVPPSPAPQAARSRSGV